MRRERQTELLENLKSKMTQQKKRGNQICCENGASNWLTSLPIDEKGFHLIKREFWDAVNLKYSWPISRLPSKCACGSVSNVDHALNCKKGGFVTMRHNELRDITADLLSEVCKDVCVEPLLQPLTGETFTSGRSVNKSEEARLDVSARGVWGRNQRAFCDIRIFNPNAPRYSNQALHKTYITHEKEKKRNMQKEY